MGVGKKIFHFCVKLQLSWRGRYVGRGMPRRARLLCDLGPLAPTR